VKYKNNGDIRLENSRLIFEYPQKSIPTEETASEESFSGTMFRREKMLNDIYPGEERTFVFKARLLGKENETATARAWLSYQPKNLQAGYESATTTTTIIKNIPITFEFDLSSRVDLGEELRFRLNYFSNVDYPLSDLRIQIDYPDDFTFSQSTPAGLEKNEWEVSVLNRADGGRIEVTGEVSGAVGEEKTFKARIGVWQFNEFILLKETTKTVAITEPSLYITQRINGNPEYVASPGDQLHYEVFFKNIGNKPLTNLFLILRLQGEMVDFESFKSFQGRYEVGDDSIVFDWRDVSNLQFLDVREEGEVEFWINVKSKLGEGKIPEINPVIKTKIILSQVQKDFNTKVNSQLEIAQKGFYQDEVFGNTGPSSPKVGEVTTYTVMWQVKNFNNDLKNVRVKAVLPSQVRLTGEIFPEDQKSKLAFDLQSREIVWELGDLKAGKGVSDSAPNISFQIAFAPTFDQIGQIATIIGEAEISGEDTWTEEIARTKAASIDSSLPDDPTITEETGKVQ
ncbi:MAG: hypothetical protein ABIF89_02320, partial [bacterium]